MLETEKILAGVDVFDETIRERLSYDIELGFLALNDPPWARGPGLNIVGFYAPPKGESAPESLPLVTEWKELPENLRNIHEVGKGIGRLLYNTPQAAAGLRFQPTETGMYSFRVVPERILDLRKGSDTTLAGRVGRVAQQIGRIVRGYGQGLEAVVNDLHTSYGDAEAVVLNQPPQPAARQLVRRVGNPVPPAFLIARRKNERLPLLGRHSV